ncbi:MAG: motility protein A [Candidatus Marinamargulisbacteria bacterium]
MNLMVMLGMAVCIFCLFYGIPGLWSNIGIYIDPNSFVLVLGGTFGAAIISTSPKDFISILKIVSGYMYMKRKNVDNYQTVLKLVEIAEEANRAGKENVLEMGKGYGDGFLDRGLTLMGSGLDNEFVAVALETDIMEEKKRHMRIIAMVRAMGSFAPMFGMMGTVMGVMQVLQNVTDIDAVVGGMGLALLTTMYGLIISTLYFIPITNKLKYLNDQDGLTKEIIMEGIISIMDNQIPLMVEKKLMGYLSTADKGKKKEK